MSAFKPFRRAGAAMRGRNLLLVIVVLATAERLWLAFAGGQYFFWDENRFEQFYRFYQAALAHDTATLGELFARPDYPLYTCLGMVVVAGQHALSRLFTPYGDWSLPQNPFLTSGIACSLLALSSVVCIVLVYRLARAYGGDRTEATWAAALLAASNSHLYYSRHLLPYDAALACALGALLTGRQARSSLALVSAGGLLGLSFSIYNGYWYLPLVLLIAVGFDCDRGRITATRIGITAGGVLLGAGVPYAIGGMLTGIKFFHNVVQFAAANKLAYFSTLRQDPTTEQNLLSFQSVTIGLMAEGWSLPWEYLWHAEGFLGLGVVATIIVAVHDSRRNNEAIPFRFKHYSVALVLSYLLLTIFSVILQIFSVNGRNVKPLVVFFALGGGWAMRRIATTKPLNFAFVVILLCAGSHSFLDHARRVFPTEVRQQLARQGIVPQFLTSFADSFPWPQSTPTSRPDLALLNAQTLFPTREYRGFPAGEVLFSLPHPLTYRPYQYEGATPEERTNLRCLDIAMKLIRLAPTQ